MDHPEGARETGDGRLGFDRRVRLEFHGSKISSDGGLLVMRELDNVLGLSDLASGALNDTVTQDWIIGALLHKSAVGIHCVNPA